MDDFKRFMLTDLRAFARKHLGSGHSRLKSKGALIEALKRKMPSLFGEPEKLPDQQPSPRKNRAETPSFSAIDRATDAASLPQQKKPAPVVENFFQKPSPSPTPNHRITEPPPAGNQPAAQKNFRAHPLYDEKLGEFPKVYQDGAAVALARDPETLYVFWDLNPHTQATLGQGMDHPAALMRVYDGANLAREVNFSLESGSFYLYQLSPGRSYSIEICLSDLRGRIKVLARTNSVTLPASGPSSERLLRWLRIPWYRVEGSEGVSRVEFREPLDTVATTTLWASSPQGPFAQHPSGQN